MKSQKHALFLISFALLASIIATVSYASEVNDSNTLEINIDNQVKELRDLYDNYSEMVEDVDKAILGINKLGIHYNKLSGSLLNTKKLIHETILRQKQLEDENEKLRRILLLPKKEVNDLLSYQESKNRVSNILVSSLGSIIGTLLFSIITFFAGIVLGRKVAAKKVIEK